MVQDGQGHKAACRRLPLRGRQRKEANAARNARRALHDLSSLQRLNIDLAIATGVSGRMIATRFGVGADSVCRHGRDHLTPEVRAALATKGLAREGDVRRRAR